MWNLSTVPQWLCCYLMVRKLLRVFEPTLWDYLCDLGGWLTPKILANQHVTPSLTE